MTEGQALIPYWNVNMPTEQWTSEPPAALLDIDENDKQHMSIKDEDFHALTWSDVQEVIRKNRLELFKRVPSDLRRYREHMAVIKSQYGSVMNFILKERVRWTDLTPKAGPFEDPSDFKILVNDWPYGIDPKIVHIVVWTKFDFEEDLDTGDLTPRARRQINDYVTRTFRRSENPEHVVWFKNWAALKSIHAVEHFHIMMYDPDPAFIRNVAGNDIPLSEQLAKEDQ